MHALLSDRKFARHLLTWFANNDRPLPWKNLRDPYLIWISEVILQQTRAEQGRPYFERFREKFPSVRALATASEEEVLREWQGLGYYSRARNLHQAARHIHEELGGVFPDDYASIRALKGVGDYSAAAIASFAYSLPYAVVDGNVHRVLARVFGIELEPHSSQGKKHFAALAQQLLDPNRAADYNQAIMDFGATCCTPSKPACETCPFQPQCVAFKHNQQAVLPKKKQAAPKKNRYFNFLLIEDGESLLLQRRTEKDIWQGLFQLPLVETSKPLQKPGEWLQDFPLESIFLQASKRYTTPYKSREVLSHQYIHVCIWHIERTVEIPAPPESFLKARFDQIQQYAFPKALKAFFDAWEKTPC